jgi:hypothetical protein
MDMSEANLSRIEDAIASPTSPLAVALNDLGACSNGRGTCLVIEHEDFGEAFIADPHWNHGRNETMEIREQTALVDVREGFGFKRLAILIEPSEDVGPLDEGGCALAIAALSVTEELARIATSGAARPEMSADATVNSVGKV